MFLTENFTMKEMTVTSQPFSNEPQTTDHILNLLYLCAIVLQPARNWLAMPIKVNSGYRSPKVNTAIGGAKNSQHMQGEAADIQASPQPSPQGRELKQDERSLTPKQLANKRLFEYIRDNLPYDQLIDEKNYRWIHVSLKRIGKNRHQVLHL